MGLGYKLIVAPLLILVLYAGLIGLRGRTTEVTLFEAAMPPQIGGSIVAIQYGLDARLISLMVGIGAVAAFLTLPVWRRVFMSRGASEFPGSDCWIESNISRPRLPQGGFDLKWFLQTKSGGRWPPEGEP